MKRTTITFFLTILFLVSLTQSISANWLESNFYERNDGSYFSLETDLGEIVTYTARILDIGDSYIAANNNRYEVVGMDGDTIKVEVKEVISLPDVAQILPAALTEGESNSNNWNIIGIYHTHNAESYVPTSGIDSSDDGNGDILQVGKALANFLEAEGYEVFWSDTSHLPHDGEAYIRSRRTAMDLLEKQPVTLLDVHRDATPPEVYETEIEGQPSTKIRLVVGRQNVNRDTTLEYAKRIKAIADEQFPDLIEGIFDARGNYNQDLGPRVILLEFGAHTNPLEQAQQAAEFFAKVIPAAAGLSSPEAAAQEAGQLGSVAWRTIGWIVGIVVVFVVGFMILNKQGFDSITNFFKREFVGNRNSDDDQDND